MVQIWIKNFRSEILKLHVKTKNLVVNLISNFLISYITEIKYNCCKRKTMTIDADGNITFI